MLKIIGKNNWLYDYVQWSGQNESPRKYHLFVGLVLLASVLARRVYFPRMDKVFPNLYVIFVSPPGTGKSTASDIGEALLRRLNPGIRPRLKSGKVTPEAFRNWLSRRETIFGHPALDGAIGTVFADELSVFLGRQRYNEGMVSMLTKLYGCPDVYEDETIAWGNIRLSNVCITLIGTTVDDALIKSVNENALLGGFVSRVLWVVGQDEGLRVAFPRPLDTSQATKLLNHLVSLTNLQGEITLEPEARKIYEDWYKKQPKAHPIIGGYYERKPTHVLKIAMLLHAGDYSRRGRLIGVGNTEKAIRLSTVLEPDIENVVTTIQTGRSARQVDRVYDLIRLSDYPVPFSEIVNFMYKSIRSIRDVDQTLEILFARGLIEEVKVEGVSGPAYVEKKKE